ncbi:MAG TPA: DUF1059 domain-containing protein [Alphaproteobacteria bacterium]|nr:DUF1059 domain-containing protein [Alphaproteobacteria bacterium]
MPQRIELPCSAVVPGCEFVAHGASQAELSRKMTEHLRVTHGVEHLSHDLKHKLGSAIDSAERRVRRSA